MNTAPGTPAPLKDNRDNFAEQMKNANLTERSKEVLPPLSTSFLQANCGDVLILIYLQQGAVPRM